MSIKKVVHTKQIILYLDTNPIKYIQFSSVFMKNKLVWISIFAISMAFLESTIVVYLRELYYQDNIQNIFPLKFLTQINYSLEIGREISTLLMIFSVAVLVSGVSISKAFITFLYIFGLWDIFYYIWLKLIMSLSSRLLFSICTIIFLLKRLAIASCIPEYSVRGPCRRQ